MILLESIGLVLKIYVHISFPLISAYTGGKIYPPGIFFFFSNRSSAIIYAVLGCDNVRKASSCFLSIKAFISFHEFTLINRGYV